MRKPLSLLVLLFVLFITISICYAADLKFMDYSYTILSDGSVEIIGYDGDDEVIIIPEKIEENPVTSIASNVFLNNNKITEITLPDTVISIGSNAFSECTSLKKITLPEGLSLLSEYAFQGDEILENIVLPASLVHIGNNPFDRCGRISEITFSGDNNFYVIENGILYNKSEKLLVSYPGGKTDKNYKIPEWISEIDYAAFSENQYLEEIALPDSVTKINGNPFCGCNSLKRIYISSLNQNFAVFSNSLINIHSLELISYLWGSNSDTYKVPEGIKTISREAFYRHKELLTVILPETLIYIEDAAFAESGLTEIKIPENVISLGNHTFSNCQDLKSIKLPFELAWIGDYAFFNCENLSSVTFPKSLRTIGEGAFCRCTSLTELIFPEDLYIIGEFAFVECTGVKTIDFSPQIISIGRGAFLGIEDLTVYASPGSLGEEWAKQNNIPVKHKDIDYVTGDIV